MITKSRLGFIGPVASATSPHDSPCAMENGRLAQAVAVLDPVWLGDIKIRTEVLHLTRPPAGATARFHLHPFLEVTCVMAGAMDYHLQDRNIPVKTGEIFCMPPEVLHGWHNRSPDCLLFGFLLSVSPTRARSDSLGFRLNQAAKNLGYRLQRVPSLQRAFENLREEVRGERHFQQDAVLAYIRLILSLVFRELAGALPARGLSSQAEPLSSRSEQLFLQSKAFVEANLAFGSSLVDVARHLGISARHANRMFKAREGITMGQFIAARRLELARNLLRERRDTSIKNVAALCGFKDVSYFCRFFREHAGVSPVVFGRDASARKGKSSPSSRNAGRRR